ncbi:LysR family transcriptional regulator [Nocardia sp. NPDC058379]|uniref:LysR family transcriptional regulator n=1 Tax=unclassified Nocardia TaxID=2637762 RepID=UPI0036501B3C
MSELDLRHLRSFLAVAQQRSITRAGTAMHLTQQAVSAHVQQLERSLGVALLVRTSRGVLLTPAGEELALGAATVVDDLTRLVHRVRAVADAQTGTLRLACCPAATALFAVAVAEALETTVPGLQVSLRSARHPKDELELLRTGGADAAFMWLPIADIGLHHATVRRDRRAVALSPRHALAHRTSVTLADIAEDPVLRPDVLTSDQAQRFWAVDPRPDGRSAPLGPIVPTVEDCLLEVGRNRGVWIAPQPLGTAMPIGDLRWVQLADADPVDLAVVWTEQAPEPLITRLIAEVRAVVGPSTDVGHPVSGRQQ